MSDETSNPESVDHAGEQIVTNIVHGDGGEERESLTTGHLAFGLPDWNLEPPQSLLVARFRRN
jgi:hypothetical protein